MIPDNSGFIEVLNLSSGLCDSSYVFPSPLSSALPDASCWCHDNGQWRSKEETFLFSIGLLAPGWLGSSLLTIIYLLLCTAAIGDLKGLIHTGSVKDLQA